MSSDAIKQYRMQLNVLQQAGYAKFEIKVESCAPSPSEPRWRAVVTVLGVSVALSRSVYIETSTEGMGPSQSAAKGAACKEMLHIFASVGVEPGEEQ